MCSCCWLGGGLGVRLGGGQQARIHQASNQRIQGVRGIIRRAQLGQRELATGVGAALAKLRQAQQGATGQVQIGKLRQHGLGMTSHRDHQPTVRRIPTTSRRHRFGGQLLIGGQGQLTTDALFPQQHQRLLQQRQHAWLVGSIGEQALSQRWLDADADAGCRLGDRRRQSVAPQRCHFQSLSRVDRPQLARHQVGIKVGAQGQHQGVAVILTQLLQSLAEAALGGAVVARKQLLKLVNKQQQSRWRGRTGYRLTAQRLIEAGLRRGTRSQHLRGQLWAKLGQKSRQHQRRLTRARGADHQHKPLLAQVLLQPGDLGAASEKPAGLVFGKRHQARIGTARLHQLQVGEALRLQARQHRGNWARKQRSRY